MITEPSLLELAADEFRDAAMMNAVIDGLQRCLPDLPEAVRQERTHMTYTLMVHFCAQRERAAAPAWEATAAGLIDAIVGLLRAPVTDVTGWNVTAASVRTALPNTGGPPASSATTPRIRTPSGSNASR
ncbi:hypothetical protein QLQ12_34225 [Actinoplanes sp. NEAU-A12]|uniref:MftR C-terminal domain-containing protein n=1 Tax=Actinoplanes sandaracinus TaxID=3045177 RepID=A0ABT6WVA3_9ACTN|nr:hypothetical protein [Actinoplanes sandaracinus]MDI6103683.1 hypothetical protein [Actinoplanes sandaracinus]